MYRSSDAIQNYSQQQNEEKMPTLLDQVKQYCTENYNAGFDVFVECYSDAELLEEIGTAKSLNSAVKNLKKFVSIREEAKLNCRFGDY